MNVFTLRDGLVADYSAYVRSFIQILGVNYVLTTGFSKSLACIVPIVDHVLRRGSGKGMDHMRLSGATGEDMRHAADFMSSHGAQTDLRFREPEKLCQERKAGN